MNDDLISRQAVLALPRNRTRNMMGEIVEETIDVEAIKSLPSAEPQRDKGEWINHDNFCECPFCHTEWNYFDNEVEWFKYCPNCGADMRGIQNDDNGTD